MRAPELAKTRPWRRDECANLCWTIAFDLFISPANETIPSPGLLQKIIFTKSALCYISVFCKASNSVCNQNGTS